MTRNNNLEYVYDKNGNLIKIYENKKLLCKYYYDDLNRVIREDSRSLKCTITYEYNNSNKLLKRNVHKLTFKNKLDAGIDSDLIKYSTEDSTHMISYNNEISSYSNNGLPIIYRDASLTWSKNNELLSIDNIASFKYNKNRINKQIGEELTLYYYKDNNLQLQIKDEVIRFNYKDKLLIGFDLLTDQNVSHFTYLKNCNNDIIGIFNAENELICKYAYDIFGNHTIFIKNNQYYINMSSNKIKNAVSHNFYVANLNPFRFHSYYFDTETGLYYTNGNYYDSQVGNYIC